MAFEVTCKQIKIERDSELQETMSVFYDWRMFGMHGAKLIAFGKLFQVL